MFLSLPKVNGDVHGNNLLRGRAVGEVDDSTKLFSSTATSVLLRTKVPTGDGILFADSLLDAFDEIGSETLLLPIRLGRGRSRRDGANAGGGVGARGLFPSEVPDDLPTSGFSPGDSFLPPTEILKGGLLLDILLNDLSL